MKKNKKRSRHQRKSEKLGSSLQFKNLLERPKVTKSIYLLTIQLINVVHLFQLFNLFFEKENYERICIILYTN
jgi:hypothetical protein